MQSKIFNILRVQNWKIKNPGKYSSSSQYNQKHKLNVQSKNRVAIIKQKVTLNPRGSGLPFSCVLSSEFSINITSPKTDHFSLSPPDFPSLIFCSASSQTFPFDDWLCPISPMTLIYFALQAIYCYYRDYFFLYRIWYWGHFCQGTE